MPDGYIDLRPLVNESGDRCETEEEYVSRASRLAPNLHPDILSQWLFEHWHQASSNYSRLGWRNLRATLEERETPLVPTVKIGRNDVIDNLKPIFDPARGASRRIARIRDHFLELGTWPRPPIFLVNEPELADCSEWWWGSPLHLVEGHHRMACFVAFLEAGRALAAKHKFWLLERT